jgi:hypothetical protein
MPTFKKIYVESEDIDEIISFLQEEGYTVEQNENESMNESIFNQAISKIKHNWLRLSHEEEELIMNISKRF